MNISTHQTSHAYLDLQSFRSHPCVDCIVAPYEADAQLTYLSTHKFIDLIITEDSDLIPFGSEKVVISMISQVLTI